MRVFVISFCCVAVLVLSLLGLREWALIVPSPRFEHAFLDSKPAPHEAVRIESIEDARAAVSLFPDVIFWLDLRFTSDGRFLILDPEIVRKALTIDALGMEKWKGPVLHRYSENELRLIFPEAVRLPDFLSGFPGQRMILNVVDNSEGIHTKLIELVEPFQPDRRFLFQSETDIILKSLKEKKPLWLYGSSRSDLMKILTFESIGLEAASPFRGDVFISPFQLMGRDAFNDGVLREMRRRNKEIFLGPLLSAEEYEKARDLGPQGFIFSSFELFKSVRRAP